MGIRPGPGRLAAVLLVAVVAARLREAAEALPPDPPDPLPSEPELEKVPTYGTQDGLGSVRLVVDTSGTVQASADTDEYGNPISVTGPVDLVAHTWCGGWGVRNEIDTESLYYMRRRWMDPAAGRFLSPDPIDINGGLNLYQYANANPTGLVDPSGLRTDPAYILAVTTLSQAGPKVAAGAGCMTTIAYGALVSLPFALLLYGFENTSDQPMGPGPSGVPGPIPSSLPSQSSPPRGMNNPVVAAAVNAGNAFHYNMATGGPAQLQALYTATNFTFTPRGAAGADVWFSAGTAPWNTTMYPWTKWPQGYTSGDFKPDTRSGRYTFKRAQQKGKLPPNCYLIPYDPKTGKLAIP